MDRTICIHLCARISVECVESQVNLRIHTEEVQEYVRHNPVTYSHLYPVLRWPSVRSGVVTWPLTTSFYRPTNPHPTSSYPAVTPPAAAATSSSHLCDPIHPQSNCNNGGCARPRPRDPSSFTALLRIAQSPAYPSPHSPPSRVHTPIPSSEYRPSYDLPPGLSVVAGANWIAAITARTRSDILTSHLSSDALFHQPCPINYHHITRLCPSPTNRP